jgi:heme oxygenase
MYDSFVDQMLGGYKQQDSFAKFHRKDLLVYDRFKEIAKRFREHYNLSAFTIKDIDKFLWLAGKKYYPASWEAQS